MKKLFIIAAFCFVVSASLLVVMTVSKTRGPDPLTPDPLFAGVSIPAFTLTDQAGRPFTRESLLGRVTIVDFMFTNCPFICPLLTAKMRLIADELKDTPARFVSISVDPTRDTPDRLAAYATEREIDTARWSFLTGDFATIKLICSDTLKFALEEDPGTPVNLADGTTMSNIIHPGHFVLIGPGAEVLGIYAAKDDMQVAALIARARAASRLLPAP
ncbi:MAG: SCO family protein [Phycisphaerales bacterium]